MWDSAAMCFRNGNRGQDSFLDTGACDRNSANFPENEKDDLNKMSDELVEVQMIKRKEPAGRAARALRDLRLRVKKHPNKPELTLAQMSKECGFYNKAGDTPPSTYQYNEREFTGDYFTKDKVDKFKIPLVERGIPEAEIYAVLTGFPNTFPLRHPEVDFPTSTARRVPVISRDAALRISRGELTLGAIAKLDPAVIQKLEAAGAIMGWESLRGVSDQTVILEVLDGLGTEIAVDLSDKVLVDGRQYVLRHGDKMVFVTYEEGMLIAEEGPEINKPLEFGKQVPIVLGRVCKVIQNA